MKKLLILIVCISANLLYSQPSKVWIKRYNGPGNREDYCKALEIDKSGNIYVGGTGTGTVTSGDYTIIKYSPEGNIRCVATYSSSGSYNDDLYSIAVDTNYNIYASGETRNGITTVKFDSSGNIRWIRSYDDFSSIKTIGNKVLADNSGNVYVWGVIWTNYNAGFIMIKYDSRGVTKWVRRYYDDFGCVATDMAFDNDGNIYAIGDAFRFNTDVYLTIKYNPDGDTLWTQIYRTPGYYSHTSDMAIDTSGNVYVTGESGGSPFLWYLYKYATVKYDRNGNFLWARKYDGLGSDRDFAFAIAVDKTGNAYITGESSGPENTFDYATVKYNSNGDSLWVKRYNGPGHQDDIANSIIVDDAGNVYVTGMSKPLRNQWDFATIKYSSSGNQLWVSRYDGTANSDDLANSVKADFFGNIYVSGTSYGMGSERDFLTIRYSQITGIQSQSSIAHSDYTLSQNYPNPFNPVTKLGFGISGLRFVSLIVFNTVGKEVVTLVNEKRDAGYYETSFDGSNLPSGMYFYRLTVDGNTVDTKRMALVK